MFPGVVDVEQENLEYEKVHGISGISLPDGKKQGTRTDEIWMSFQIMWEIRNTNAIRNVNIPIRAGSFSKLRPKRAMVWSPAA